MLRMSRFSQVLAIALSCGAVALGCGDDDTNAGGRDGGDAGRSGSGGRGGDGGGLPRTDGGLPERGSEGWRCGADEPCNEGLRCAATPFTVNGRPVGVCAVPCEDNTDCNGGSCISYSQRNADAHCVDVIDEEYELCGVADTSICSSNLTCLYFPDYPIGVCVDLCALDGAGDEDAGASDGTCSGAQVCVDGVLADPAPNEGVCGTLVERGDECGLELGLYCGAGDVCAPEDPEDELSVQRCYQDCSEAGTTCQEGRCMIVQGLFAYCR